MKAVEMGHRGSTCGEQELYASRNWTSWRQRCKINKSCPCTYSIKDHT